MSDGYETHELELAFKAGAASRDAEVVSLTNQRDYEYVRAENAEQDRLLVKIAAKDAEIARLKTVPMKYRRMAFNAQLQDEVARLEQENDQLRAITITSNEIERLYAIAFEAGRQAEREECATLCDMHADGWEKNPGSNPMAGYVASSNCAFTIRARGDMK